MEALTRRQFLTKIGQTLGVAGVAYAMQNTGLMSMAHAEVDWHDTLPPDTGTGKSVAVLGAGVSGLRAAWELAAAGFDVTVLEAAPYMGGRSQTIRPSSGAYKSNWLGRQNGKFPASAYHTQIIQEKRDDKNNVLESHVQTCEFTDDAWEKGDIIGDPDDIYLNAGPGRIPSFHNALLDHCRKFDVDLEPFTFTTRQNLMQKDEFNDGEPARLGRVKSSLREHMTKILRKLEAEGKLDETIEEAERAKFRKLLTAFGGFDGEDDKISNRRGYEQGEGPGAWLNEGKIRPQFNLTDLLNDEAWEPGLFNDTRVYWQTSLMQPTGGMDRIWTNMLTKPLPAAAGGGMIERLVQVDAPVTKIKNISEAGTEKVDITWSTPGEGDARTEHNRVFDFCVSTMGPKRLAVVVEDFSLANFSEHLKQVPYTASCKVGWQSRGRWFEEDYEIYGGISWIADEFMTQMWYPSQDFHSRNATLTGAYNRGPESLDFAKLSLSARLDVAAEQGAKLHNIPGRGLPVDVEKFKSEMVYFDRGLSIAWQDAPYQDGGWQDHAFEHGDEKVTHNGEEVTLWSVLAKQPINALYLAGDWISHTPGWQEGSIRTAMASVYAIAGKCSPAQSLEEAGACRYENL